MRLIKLAIQKTKSDSVLCYDKRDKGMYKIFIEL